jgi:hypothetical protein
MSAIRMLFSWLTEKSILSMNPAREVTTEKFSRTEGKTPAFDTEQVQKVLDKIDTSNEVGLRDRALFGTLAAQQDHLGVGRQPNQRWRRMEGRNQRGAREGQGCGLTRDSLFS